MSTKTNKSAGSQFTPKGPTQGNVLVDPKTGDPINTVDGKLDVNASVTATIGDIEIDAVTSSVRVEDPATGAHVRVELDGSINANVKVDAGDGDNVAIGNTWKKMVDQPDAVTTYIGSANPGTTLAAASWQIKRITVTGTITAIEFADGNLNFDNVWNNRASLTYN